MKKGERERERVKKLAKNTCITAWWMKTNNSVPLHLPNLENRGSVHVHMSCRPIHCTQSLHTSACSQHRNAHE